MSKKRMEMPGIEPGASHMRSMRSTTELHPQSTRMGFEPTRAEHNGLAVHRLNHSATSSRLQTAIKSFKSREALRIYVSLRC